MIETKTWNLREKTRIVLHLPETLERIQFFVRGSGLDVVTKLPVVWVRSRKYCEADGEGAWGQSICFQVDACRYGCQASKTCSPGALWLSPGETYEFEVTSEGFGLDLVEITCMLPDEVVEVEQPAVPKKESWLDNPLLWAALVGAGFFAFILVTIYRTVPK